MLYAIIAVIVLILDQWLKYWTTVNITLSTGESPLINGVIKLVNVHNDGAAFSFLGDVPYMRWVFIGLTALVAVVVIVLLVKKVFRGKFATLCLVMILAGAIGNCIDRIIHGYVVDMFKLEFVNFAVFNVADIVLTVFCLLFVVYLFVGDKGGDEKSHKAKAPSPKKGSRRKAETDDEDVSDFENAENGETSVEEKSDPFWDTFKSSLRDEVKPEEPKEKPKEFDFKAAREVAKPAKTDAPEFDIPPKVEIEAYSLEDILAEFK